MSTKSNLKPTNDMLDYVKLILEKVSFDKSLFLKEFKKAKNALSDQEMNELQSWCSERFGGAFLANSTRKRA